MFNLVLNLSQTSVDHEPVETTNMMPAANIQSFLLLRVAAVTQQSRGGLIPSVGVCASGKHKNESIMKKTISQQWSLCRAGVSSYWANTISYNIDSLIKPSSNF